MSVSRLIGTTLKVDSTLGFYSLVAVTPAPAEEGGAAAIRIPESTVRQLAGYEPVLQSTLDRAWLRPVHGFRYHVEFPRVPQSVRHAFGG